MMLTPSGVTEKERGRLVYGLWIKDPKETGLTQWVGEIVGRAS